MRSRVIVAGLVALLGCSSSGDKPPGSPEPTESEKEVAALLAEGSRLNDSRHYRDAADRFKSAVVIDPRNVRAQYSLAAALENAHDWKGAADAYERTIQLAPKLAAARHNLGEVRLMLGDRAAARRELEVATTLDPKCADSWISLGRVEVEDGHPELAARRLEKAVLAVDDAEVWFHLGYARELSKDAKGAREAYDHALKMNPRHVQALTNLGMLCHEGRDFDGAIALWRRAVEAEPRFAPAQRNLGVALHEDKGAAYLALPHLRSYLELGGEDRRVKQWVDEIVAATRTYRSMDRATATFDRFEKGELVTADGRFVLRDGAVAEKAKGLARGDKVLIFFDSTAGSRVIEIRPAK